VEVPSLKLQLFENLGALVGSLKRLARSITIGQGDGRLIRHGAETALFGGLGRNLPEQWTTRCTNDAAMTLYFVDLGRESASEMDRPLEQDEFELSGDFENGQ
jgi:hypothetical protein